MTCHGLVNVIRLSRHVIEATECPALNWYLSTSDVRLKLGEEPDFLEAQKLIRN
jgi:hypothetical protein